MTLLDARAILQKPVFGDPRCIEAVRALLSHARLQELIGTLEDAGVDCDCEECDGAGHIDCPECDGSGTVTCDDCGGKSRQLKDLPVKQIVALAEKNGIPVPGEIEELAA